MTSNPENRNNARINHRCPVTIEDLKSGMINKAGMQNFSKQGFYLEADILLQPGEEIFVGINNSPLTSSTDTYECYRAKIIWRKKLKTSSYYYGYGIKHTPDHKNTNSQNDNSGDWEDIRTHQRKRYSKSILFVAQDQLFEGLTKDISPAGVFIKTNEKVFAGQILNLTIPLKKEKTAEVKAEVVWSNPEGFGVKFLKITKK